MPAFYMNADSVSDPTLIKLTVWTENIDGNVSLAVPKGLILYNGNVEFNNFDGATYIAKILVDDKNFTNGNHSYTYIFIKTSDYSGEVPFEVTINDGSNTYTAVEAPLN